MPENPADRVRRFCEALPDTTEKLSHGAPTWFTGKRVYTMFANNHHNDGHVAVWIAAAEGVQAELVNADPAKFFVPPYVGKGGWVGVELGRVDDDELGALLHAAWKLIAAKAKKPKSW